MVLNKKLVIKVLCAVMALVGFLMLIPCAVSLIYGETVSARAFAVCAVPMIAAGYAAFRLTKAPDTNALGLRDGFFIVASAWFVLSLLGSLPFMISGTIPNVFDAFFETASGFTTTGASILPGVEDLPKGMLFWRSFTHWVGGMGILVLTIAILPALGIGGQKIMRAETTGPSMDKMTFTFNDTARSLYLIYSAMTVIEVVLLLISGMDLYDSLVYTFGTVGTGGFATKNDGLAGYAVSSQIIIAVFMMLAGINFNLYYLCLNKKAGQALKDPELKCYLGITGGSTLFIMVMLIISGQAAGIFDSFRLAYFQVTSILTTTGYSTFNFDLWPLPVKVVLMMLMFIGGCASSTGGGMKVIRVMMAFKIAWRGVQKRIHPSALAPVKIGRRIVSQDIMRSVSEFLILYLATLLFGTVLVSLEKVSLMTAFTSVLACFSNIGPGFEAVGPAMNFGFYSGATKLFLSVLMIAGRLELFTIFLMFTPAFWSKR
ncbi:MAG: TrkH family potassium uptake protein [Firmicutes bacterium]|nr:TrkH family potassium uptake protein [Bacillota bacterium]